VTLLIHIFAWSFAASSLGVAQKVNQKVVAQPSEMRVNKKMEREILKMEDQLRRALVKCDTVMLDRILADYYADAYEGSERAIAKKGTIARCKDGAGIYYAIDDERDLSVRVDIVVIEGISRVNSGNKEAEPKLRVKRYWTKKEGRWQLIAQTKQPFDKEQEK
jgi:hypothetical protein